MTAKDVEEEPFDGALGMSARTTDISADAPDEPERDVGAITETFEEAAVGDDLKVGIGVLLDGEMTGGTMYPRVLNVERDVAGFDLRVSMIHDVQTDGWGRLYITGTGTDGLDPWEVVSEPYHVPTKTADARDMAAHGWVVGVEIQ